MDPIVRNITLCFIVLRCALFGFQNCGKISFDVNDLDSDEFLNILSKEPQFCETVDSVIYEQIYDEVSESFSDCQPTRCEGGLDLSFDLDEEPFCS